jgi:hypothetical protein
MQPEPREAKLRPQLGMFDAGSTGLAAILGGRDYFQELATCHTKKAKLVLYRSGVADLNFRSFPNG